MTQHYCDAVTTPHTRVARAPKEPGSQTRCREGQEQLLVFDKEKKTQEVSQDHDHLLPEGRGELHRRGLHQDPLQVEGRLIVTRLLTIESFFF